MANAARHARAGRLTVRVRAEDGELRVRVDDDGSGLPANPRSNGLGLASMRQRAEEVGGRFALRSGSGGTSVEVALPMSAS